MEDFSEQSIRENCPDCDPNSFVLKNPLKETNNFWVVDISLAAPRFFGDRFADAFGTPEKGNWKEMRANPKLMEERQKNIVELEKIWREYLA